MTECTAFSAFSPQRSRDLGQEFGARGAHGESSRASGCLQPWLSLDNDDTWKSYFDYETPEHWKPSFNFTEGNILAVKATKVDVVDGTAENTRRVRLNSVFKDEHEFEIPFQQPLCKAYPYPDTLSKRTILLHAMYADPSMEDKPGSTLLDIPWSDDRSPSPIMLEELQKAGAGNMPELGEYHIFHEVRTARRDFNILGSNFRCFFPGKPAPEFNAIDIVAKLRASARVLERTLITTERGYLGSTLMMVRRGDTVLVVPGCTFPVLVRPKGEHYRVIGECYVEGLMEGEAMKWLDEEECKLEEILLC
ncbi:hypothetical protein BDY21DRAFT_359866 [Lineolata rhizophorae]|uniref:Uncharacterized protein n=1 Tax=Lineolata rhizophorae TaxID=578093 RepID=A0A6A6PCW1_9PEZI|nr:hypothetical protein BDY21DRAFT_359866 [Lineolata rhizophorae]